MENMGTNVLEGGREGKEMKHEKRAVKSQLRQKVKNKMHLLSAIGKAEKSEQNRIWREKNHEYDIERKRQYRIRKEVETMKKLEFTRTEYKSDEDNFQVTVEVSEVPDGMGLKEKEMSLCRVRGGGSIVLKNEQEIKDLMKLLNEFSEILKKEK